ncbi:MAG: response regulator transcription factor [Rhodobacteraceae bacterium]|nr:response regulator transcription factor [Paracoccaceae bacterium]
MKSGGPDSGGSDRIGKDPYAQDFHDHEVIRILLVDPRPLMAEALRSYLEEAGRQSDGTRFCVITSIPSDTSQTEMPFDLLLLHVSHSADVSDEISRCISALPDRMRDLPAVIYSDRLNSNQVAAAMRGGARGYLPSILDCASVVRALKLLAAGLAVFPHAALNSVSDETKPALSGRADADRAPQTTFTPREWDVMQALYEGKPNKTIAHCMGLSQSTVKVHVRSLFRKLGVHNRTEAAMIARQHLMNRPPKDAPPASQD